MRVYTYLAFELAEGYNFLSEMRCDLLPAVRGQILNKLNKYLADCAKFYQMANDERNPVLKADQKQRAGSYWKLAAERAKQLGVPLPDILRQSE